MKILIIGGTGNISRYVVKEYVDRGCEVDVINRGNRPYFHIPNVNYIICDVNYESKIAKVVEGKYWDIVIDFTIMSPYYLELRMRTMENHFKHFVLISSGAVYKNSAYNYIPNETYTEDSEIYNIYWEYGYEKSLCERALLEYCDEHKDLRYTIIRPGLTYSELYVPYAVYDSCGNPGYAIYRVENDLPMILLKDKGWKLRLMHTKDFAHSLYFLLQEQEAENNIFNLSGDEYIHPNEMIRLLYKYLDKEINCVEVEFDWLAKNDLIPRGTMKSYINLDNSKAKKVLKENYQSTNHMDEAIEASIRVYREFRNCPDVIHWSDKHGKNVFESVMNNL